MTKTFTSEARAIPHRPRIPRSYHDGYDDRGPVLQLVLLRKAELIRLLALLRLVVDPAGANTLSFLARCSKRFSKESKKLLSSIQTRHLGVRTLSSLAGYYHLHGSSYQGRRNATMGQSWMTAKTGTRLVASLLAVIITSCPSVETRPSTW